MGNDTACGWRTACGHVNDLCLVDAVADVAPADGDRPGALVAQPHSPCLTEISMLYAERLLNMIRSTCAFALATLLAVTTASAQTFEVAAIKPSNPDPANPLSMVPMVRPQPGGRVTVSNFPLKMLIAYAYEMQDFRVDGGSPTLMSAKFDITAKSSTGNILTPKEMRPLLKNLLIERFKLKAHTEPREMRIYDLVLARSDGRLGPDIKPSTSDCSKADEINAQRADALAKGDISAVVAKPGEVLHCTLAPNVSGGPMNISVHGDGQEIAQLIELLTPMTGRY